MSMAINDLINDSKAEGKEEGIYEGKYMGAIGMCKTFKLSFEDAVLKIMENFSLSNQEAAAVVKKYW